MADSKPFFLPNQSLDLGRIQEEAKHRWLRVTEICEILRDHKKFKLTPQPPVKPSAGSLFLFDRKVLRYFRRDGHRWRKKKDGKTVKEAHEKLKISSVDVLHCYYAHGEDNENFQRRCYWMLDEQFQNIVLVHYREVKEEYKSGINHSKVTDSELQSLQTNSSHFLEQAQSETVSKTYQASNPSAVDWSGQSLSSDFEGVHVSDPDIYSLVQLFQPTPSDPSFHSDGNTGTGFVEYGFGGSLGLSTWSEGHELSRSMVPPPEQQVSYDQLKNSSCSLAKVDITAKVESSCQLGEASNNEVAELKKLDSFGRWMDKEIGRDCNDSIMASDSGRYWSALDTECDDKEVSSLPLGMHLETDVVGPSLSQQQLFSIHDFAPEWADSEVNTKVLIVGSFMGQNKHFSDYKWCCMFGEIEVAAEVLGENVFRCQTPCHAPGCVPFYVTCSNRLACSEVREFEFRESTSRESCMMADNRAPEDEVRFLIRLIKLLSSGTENIQFHCTAKECEECKLMNDVYSRNNDNKNGWGRFDEARMISDGNPKEMLFKILLKDKLLEWLVCQRHEVGKRLNILDDQGQGIIHLAAALGFDWAMGPIIAAGVSPNFRDARGKTALHWASYYGREETVVVLVRLGAAAGAVEDPTPAFPGGQKAADLAASRGHKGIAGFLAETDLASHLSLLTVKGGVMDNAVEVKSDHSMDNAREYDFPSGRVPKEEISLRGSLAAVRKSARAAALIQDTFRVHSFRHRQMTKSNIDIPENPLDLVALGCLSKVQKKNDSDDYLHSAAAIKIQQKYRGWKRRKDFFKIRKRIVDIQAHVRGHQVRKHYKKVVWSVTILEKVILRWRRKKYELREFWMRKAIETPDVQKNDEYDFLQIGQKQKAAGVQKALARVQSMARYQEARDQYLRLVRKLEEHKVLQEESSVTEVNSGE